MNNLASHILRVGLGITFIVIGFVVWAAPEGWAGFLQPWARNFMPSDIVSTMKSTAALDVILGVWLLVNRVAWLPALIASAHLLIILITTTAMGVIIERDLGLLAAALALFFQTAPRAVRAKLGVKS